MSQRILKCTVCGSDHSIFHCENRCGVCHGDSRQRSCSERLPQKRKKTSKSTAFSQQAADTLHDDLKKKYESLQKDYKKVGQAFQNQQEQNQELTALLEEREKEAEELATLVQNKDAVIKKPREAPLKCKEGHRRTPSCDAETRATRRPTRITTATPADGRHTHQHPQPGQHTRMIRPRSPDDEREQMQHGLCLPSCRLSSEHTTRLRGDSRTEKGQIKGTGPHPPRPRSDIGARSGGCLSQKTSVLHPGHEQHEERGAAVANEVGGMILRVKYLVYFTTHKTAPLGATKSMKVNDQQ